MKIPEEFEWRGYEDDFDAKYAHKIFFGKSNSEMQSSFRRNVIERTCEIRFMPKLAFQYYIFGLRDYVLNREFGFYDSADAASCFIGLVLEKLKKEPNKILPIVNELLPAVEFVSHNQELYEAKEDIYGSFKEKYEEIKSHINSNT